MGIHLSILGPADVRQSWIRRFGWTDVWSYRGRQYLACLDRTMESFTEDSRGLKEPGGVSESLVRISCFLLCIPLSVRGASHL